MLISAFQFVTAHLRYQSQISPNQSTSAKAALLGLFGRIVVTLVVVSALGIMLVDEKVLLV